MRIPAQEAAIYTNSLPEMLNPVYQNCPLKTVSTTTYQYCS